MPSYLLEQAPPALDECGPAKGGLLRFDSVGNSMSSARKTASSVPAVGRASRSTLQDRVYVKLRKALIAGKFIPGQPSSIRGLASELGTSPIPVREALRRLVTEQAFEIHPNGSIVVPIMTRTRFHDLQRARILIEGFATELAAGSIVNGGAKRDHCGGVKRDRLAAAGLSP